MCNVCIAYTLPGRYIPIVLPDFERQYRQNNCVQLLYNVRAI